MTNLNAMFDPESIAVIGASRNPGKIGYAILENLKVSFFGKLYPINPEAVEILGLNSYHSVLDVEEAIDLAIIAVPAESVIKVLKECKKKKLKNIIIISSGFSEIGKKERELDILKEGKGMRIIGPNCLGVLVPNKMDTLFLPRKRFKRPLDGPIGFLSQSGAIGTAIMDSIQKKGIGISKFVSYGNAADVTELDLLEYLGNDVSTRSIAMYIESIRDGQGFIKTAKKITPHKPIVVLKAGKTEKGSSAVMSHTGKLAGPAEVFSAALKQAGIIEAKTTEELFDYAKIMAQQPTFTGKNIAIVTNGGGFGVMAADAAMEAGFDVPDLTGDSLRRLKNAFPEHATARNPIDVTGDADTERFNKALEVAFKDNNIDAVVCVLLWQVPTLEDSLIDSLQDAKMSGKPFVVISMGSEYTVERSKKIETLGIPVYTTPERAIKSLKALRDYSLIRKK